MEIILAYLLVGVVAGLLAGLLGIGGGIVIVPALSFLLQITPDYVMHVAVGTSLAIVAVTATSSAWAHSRKGTVKWPVIYRLTGGLIVGTLIGVLLVNQLSSDNLRVFFAVFELLVAIHIAIGVQTPSATVQPSMLILSIASLTIGIVSAFAGVGGGVMLVPLLLWLGLTFKQAISTSAACGVPIAIAGSIGFMLIGTDTSAQLPEMSTGYVYWPAFLSIAFTSVLFAPLGAKLAHALPADVLRKIFASFLFVVGMLMFFA
ncbi:MAG: sulfite exporter TauE/SafE family protein [Thiohalomonadales bacterium]